MWRQAAHWAAVDNTTLQCQKPLCPEGNGGFSSVRLRGLPAFRPAAPGPPPPPPRRSLPLHLPRHGRTLDYAHHASLSPGSRPQFRRTAHYFLYCRSGLTPTVGRRDRLAVASMASPWPGRSGPRPLPPGAGATLQDGRHGTKVTPTWHQRDTKMAPTTCRAGSRSGMTAPRRRRWPLRFPDNGFSK